MNRGVLVIGFLVLTCLGFAVYVQSVMRERDREAVRDRARAEEEESRRREEEARLLDEERVRETEEDARRREEARNLPQTTPSNRSGRDPFSGPRPDAPEAAELVASGKTLARKGEYVAATADLAQAAVLAPRSATPVFYLSYLALTSGNWARALRFLDMARGRFPDWLKRAPNPRTLFGSDEAYARHVARLQRHIDANPGDADAKALLAFHYYFTKTGTHAKAMAMEALSLKPGHGTAKALVSQLENAGH